MEQLYKFELTVMTLKRVYPLEMFYKQFIYDDDKIFLGKYLPSISSPVPTEICRYLVPAEIKTERTPKELLMVVSAEFWSYRGTTIEWLEFVHSTFPQIDLLLQYSNKDKTDRGRFFTAGPEDLIVDNNPPSTLTHMKWELQWYQLKHEDLLSKLEQGLFNFK